MLEKVQNYIDEYDMLHNGDGVLAAVSGGADSVCLLSVLKILAGSRGWQVRALHMNHGLRGEEADRDERFVQELCSRLDVPLTLVHRDVASYAGEHGLSGEEAGRILRYEALENAAEAWEREQNAALENVSGGKHLRPQVRIAIAHHADDQAETILHHLLRGSGMRGLSGIRPVHGRRIRPLLCVRREEIRQWLTARGETWCEDSTNRQADYTRNRIRNHILPMMAAEVNGRAAENIVRAGALFSQADDYLEQQAREVFETYGTLDADGLWAEIGQEIFLRQHPVIRSYLVRRMLDAAAPGQKDITAKHFEQIAGLAAKQVGARCDLPGNLMAERTYQTLRVSRKAENTGTSEALEAEDPLAFSVFSYENGGEFPKNQYTKWFDYDKINGVLSVRTRREGDFITLSGGGRKTVNRFMIDEKIPRDQRDKILLLADGSHILWIVGYRISEYYKITPHTRCVLQVVKNGGKSYV